MKYLTTKEVAEQIRETEHSVAEKCANGTIRASRLGRGWRIRQSAVDDFMESRVPITEGRSSTLERGVA